LEEPNEGVSFLLTVPQTERNMALSDEKRKLAIMVDYVFGRGVSGAIPAEGMRLLYSRRSGRVKMVLHGDTIFATIRPNGSIAISIHGASLLARKRQFLQNCVTVTDDAVPFVREGRSVFCKFVNKAGKRIQPRDDVAVLDASGRVIAVGTAVVAGSVMQSFKAGVAVKVREGLVS